MRLRLTFLLFALNAALLGAIFYFDKVRSTEDLLDQSSRLVLNPDFALDLDRLTIESHNTPDPWTLEQSASQWEVVSPFKWKANPYAVEQLLFQLQRLSWESRFPVSGLDDSTQSLESYQLHDPPIRLTLQSGSTRIVLPLGAPTGVGNRLYMMSPDGDYVYVVPRGVLDSLQHDLEAFLDRRVFDLAVEEARALQIQDRAASSVRVRLERNQDRWRFVSPIETAADPDRVEAFLRDWQALEVEDFLEADASSENLSGNSIRLTLEGTGARETLILRPPDDSGEAPDHFLGRREAWPTLFRIRADRVDELRSVQEDLREKRVLAQTSKDWSSLEIQFGDLGLTLQKLENGTWQVLYTDNDGQLNSLPADETAISRIDQLLSTLEAQRFLTDAPSESDLERFGLNSPQRRVIIRRENNPDVTFLVGGLHPDESETLLYARTDQSDSVFLIRPHVLPSLSLDPYFYRERTIRALPEAAVVLDLELIHRESGLPVPFPEEDPENETRPGPRETLADFMKNIRVERFISEPFAEPLPLDDEKRIEWPYLLEARIRYPSGSSEKTESFTLYLSERLGGTTQYLGDPETGLVGTLPVSIIESLYDQLATFPETPSEIPSEPIESDLAPESD